MLFDEVVFYVPIMGQYIHNVMVADNWGILSVNVLQIWFSQMEVRILFSKYFQKIQTLGSHSRTSFE